MSELLASADRASPSFALAQPAVSVVVGGSGDIGSAIAAALSESGSATYVMDVKPITADLDVAFEAMDVTEEGSVAAGLGRALGPDGPQGPAAVVYVSGVSGPVPVTDMPLAEWERVLAVNATGAFLVAKHAIPWLVDRPWSRLVFISSMSSFVANRGRHNAHYCASKAAINGLTQQLSVTYARQHLTVNAVLPGYVGTSMVDRLWSPAESASLADMIPVGRMATPAEIAAPVLLLTSRQASYVNGALLVVDGAYTRW